MDHSQKQAKFGMSNPRYMTIENLIKDEPEPEPGKKVAWWLLKSGKISDIPSNARGEEVRAIVHDQDRRIAAVVVDRQSKKILGVVVEQGIGNAVLAQTLEREYSDEYGWLRIQFAR
jgi:hypothetical protein